MLRRNTTTALYTLKNIDMTAFNDAVSENSQIGNANLPVPPTAFLSRMRTLLQNMCFIDVVEMLTIATTHFCF
jgi:hypothetical protein